MEIALKDLKDLLSENRHKTPFDDMVDKCVFIRTVTYHYTGKIVKVVGNFVQLTKVAWVADSGRFHDALKKEEFNEVEPYPNDVFLSIESIVDFTEIKNIQELQR